MDLIFFLALSIGALAGFLWLLRRSVAQDNEARGHERIRSKRERQRLAALFDDVVSDIRKRAEHD